MSSREWRRRRRRNEEVRKEYPNDSYEYGMLPTSLS